jgi:hypothetical protein
LKPFKGEESTELTTLSLITMGWKKFSKESKGGIFYLLYPREKEKLYQQTIPLEVQKLLQQYPDLTPSDLPVGLPPSRGITHQIDLVPGAKLPNQAAYKMTPLENEEMRRKIT